MSARVSCVMMATRHLPGAHPSAYTDTCRGRAEATPPHLSDRPVPRAREARSRAWLDLWLCTDCVHNNIISVALPAF